MSYKIKEGYIHRESADFFDDTPFKDQFQKEVYKAAAEEAKLNNYNKILDIGCGSGYKLVRFFPTHNTVGVELEPTLSWLKKAYPLHRWEASVPKEEFDLVLCADVIEHLYDPGSFMEMLQTIEAKVFFISTPERDLVRGPEDMGPPKNETHYREWNTEEFVAFVSDYLEVLSSEVVSTKHGTLMLKCIKKAPQEEVPVMVEVEDVKPKKGRKPKS